MEFQFKIDFNGFNLIIISSLICFISYKRIGLKLTFFIIFQLVYKKLDNGRCTSPNKLLNYCLPFFNKNT